MNPQQPFASSFQRGERVVGLLTLEGERRGAGQELILKSLRVWDGKDQSKGGMWGICQRRGEGSSKGDRGTVDLVNLDAGC